MRYGGTALASDKDVASTPDIAAVGILGTGLEELEEQVKTDSNGDLRRHSREFDRGTS